METLVQCSVDSAKKKPRPQRHDIREFLNKPGKLKEGHKEEFEKAVMQWANTARGVLGWGGQAKMFVELGVDKQFHNLRTKKKRIRRKRMKRILKETALRDVFRHLEGFNDEGYRI